jgi:ankyrin repeat protein/uncharacterized protein YecT (DUF1311 family)
MKHKMANAQRFRAVSPILARFVGLLLAALQGNPSFGADTPKTDAGASTKLAVECGKAPTEIERLICREPSLTALDAALGPAFRDYQDRAPPAERDARASDQRLWLDWREMACPAAAKPQQPSAGEGAGSEGAVACLSRIYEQRLAVLRYERNTAAWPRIRFRPTIVEGAGTKLCEDLERDLVASFLGSGSFVNPLGEREIGFVAMPGLGVDPVVQRADIDAYNLGKPFPVLQWIVDKASARPPTIEYRAFDSPKELLSAIGRGVEPVAYSVRGAAHPVIDIDRLTRPDQTKPPNQPRAAFASSSVLPIDEMPRFFRYDGQVYLAGPMQPVPGKPGDLGIYRLFGPARLHRVCVFEAHMPMAHLPDRALSLREIEVFERAAGPLLPTGRLCAGAGDGARTLADHAAWRPWVLDRRRSMTGDLTAEQLALYMRNGALTGPEIARQYRAYVAARSAAIEALAPFYRNEFGRSPGEAKRLATRYLERKVSDGFELDPDDDSVTALFAADYADKHAAQKAALAGDTKALREALGPEPLAIAKGIKGELEEPLVSDALEHSETLRALLELGLDPNEFGASGRTPLMVAARLDLAEAAEILLAQGATLDIRAKDAVAQTDDTGDPLCMVGDKATADTPGRTALSYAAELGSPGMVRLLRDHGADPASRDSAGRRPADYVKNRTGDAAQSGEIAEMLK